jgi:DNA-binding PadR family transcriptional regulator
MRDYKFIEENNKWIIPHYQDYNCFRDMQGNIYSITLKKLGGIVKMRSDKLYRILEKMGAKKIIFLGKKKFGARDNSFYAPTKEVADQIQDWLDNIILRQRIEEKLFS